MKIEDYSKYYIQGSDHYLIPKDVFMELFNEMINWKEEVKELKKQLENYKKLGFKHLQDKNNNLKIHYEIKPSFTTRKIKELQQERDLYKEVIDEVRKFIEDWLFDAGGNGASMTYEDINELLQILDKGESNE